ncbi:MAG: hypothetical protein WCI71_05855 [Bacteroidota bacterium]
MKILTLKSTEIPENLWCSLVNSFNSVFSKSFTVGFFRHKYFTTIKGYSFHSLYLNEYNEVVGNCTIIPIEYFVNQKTVLVGLTVDIFINENYRNHTLALVELYESIKPLTFADEVQLIVGVPNNKAYSYWKHFIGWKDVGEIPYYALSLRVGNLIKQFKILNTFSLFFSYSWLYTFGSINSLFNFHEARSLIRINRDRSIIEKQRYNFQHQIKLLNDQTNISYRIENEDGVIVAYLIDYYNIHKNRTSKALFQAISYIITKEKIDLLLYVGQIKMMQCLLFKVPKRFEPKKLWLMAENLNMDISDNLLFDFKNWDFGLFNFDVR